jgi:hypothetical protein
LPKLEAARAQYVAFHFADVLAKLDELARLAEATGGGDLDSSQLSDMYLYRALSRLELGPPESAWDDLVRAARLDPARVLDPARFPPRAIAAWRRAAAEVAQVRRAEVEVVAPAGATVRIDGRVILGDANVLYGAHFVAVDAEGYEPWAAVVSVTGARERLKPPLRVSLPPDADRLVALTRAYAPQRIVSGAPVRSGDGWRFVGRELRLTDGTTLTEAAPLGGAPVAAVVNGVLGRLNPVEPPAPPKRPRLGRWWMWAAGGVAAALAVAIPVGVVYGIPSPSGTIGGSLGRLR